MLKPTHRRWASVKGIGNLILRSRLYLCQVLLDTGGDRLGFRARRLEAKLSVAEAAKLLGVSQAAVYFWESGRFMPRTEMLLRIAALYGCTADELLRDK